MECYAKRNWELHTSKGKAMRIRSQGVCVYEPRLGSKVIDIQSPSLLSPYCQDPSQQLFGFKHNLQVDMSDTQAPKQTYKASCHCGAFVYNVTTASLDNASTEVVRCNCSICARNGYLFIYVPNDQVEFTSGILDDLKVSHHLLQHPSFDVHA